jgi:hypothetical protein
MRNDAITQRIPVYAIAAVNACAVTLHRVRSTRTLPMQRCFQPADACAVTAPGHTWRVARAGACDRARSLPRLITTAGICPAAAPARATVTPRNQSFFLSSSAIRLLIKSRGLSGRFRLVPSASSGSDGLAGLPPFNRSISLRSAAARSAPSDVCLGFFAIIAPLQ